MIIHTIDKKKFELLNDNQVPVGRLIYNSNAFDKAIIETEEKYLLRGIAAGTWATHTEDGQRGATASKIIVERGSVISLRLTNRKLKYFFRRSSGWRLRFSLANIEGDDILNIIPSINWKKESHDYILQLNEEYEHECDSFLILHSVHCANCSLSMMVGGEVPALVSI